MEMTPLQDWIANKIGVAGSSLTREIIESYQLKKLQQTIELAVKHSSFYRKSLASYLGKVNCMEDIKQLPFTSAEHIRQNPLKFLCVSQDMVNRVVTLHSSGTTGESKRLYFTKEDQELTTDFFHIGMSNLVGPGDRVLILLPGQLPGSVGDLLEKGLARLGAKGIPHGLVTDPAETLQIMLEQEVNSLVGIPSQVLSLARYKNKDRKTIPLRLKSVLLSTDYVPKAITQELEKSWGCRVLNHYGMTEMGLGGGVECQALTGYHLREADLYFEILNPHTGEQVPEGEEGEVVFTTLTRQGMPLIRYRTGDRTRFIPEPCPCGTILKRMAPVTGRIEGVYRVAGGILTLRDLDEALFRVNGLLNFDANLTCPCSTDQLTIKVKMTGDVCKDSLQAVRSALDTIPTVRNGVRKGNLEVDLWMIPDQFITNGAKRTIKDLRKE